MNWFKKKQESLKWSTITIRNNGIDFMCFDIPKDMPIPPKGAIVIINDIACSVTDIHYHIIKEKLYMISIFAEKV